MYVEKRKAGNRVKYYLVHSYREKNEVKKIRKYLGADLTDEDLKKAKQEAEQQIKGELSELGTEIFNFSLSKRQIEKLNKYDAELRIHHLDTNEWQRFTEQFTYNTNAIEGSTVQLLDVPEILRKKKPEHHDEIETKGVAKAVEFIRSTKQDLSLELIRKLHKICFDGSKHFAGEFRNVEVVVKSGTGEIVHTGVPVQQLHYALDDLIGWYKENKKKFRPLVLAAILHDQFEYIHPFQDGNGRVGRLLLNFILIKNNYPPINISLDNRAEYYRTLQEYSNSQNIRHTVLFLIKQYNKTLKQIGVPTK